MTEQNENLSQREEKMVPRDCWNKAQMALKPFFFCFLLLHFKHVSTVEIKQ